MSFYKNFQRLARYNVYAPIAVLAAVAAAVSPAAAETIVVNAPDTDGVELTGIYNALINNSAISNAPNDVAVSGGDPVDFVTNNAGATIIGDGDAAVGLGGPVQTFTNSGTISSQNAFTTMFFGGGLGSFTNNSAGVIQNLGTGGGNGGGAVLFNTDTQTGGAVGSFTNQGTILGAASNDPNNQAAAVGFFSDNQNGSGVASALGSFLNSGTIGGYGWQAVYFGGPVGTFTNSGLIENLGDNGVSGGSVGVEFNADVTTFRNTGTIKGSPAGADSTGVAFFNGASVASFENGGSIWGLRNGVFIEGTTASFSNLAGGTITSTQDAAVRVDGAVNTFSNAGTISGARWNAVFFDSGVTSFTNAAGGIIQNTDALGEDGGGVGFQTDLVSGGAVGSFVNHGTIAGAANSTQFGNGVGFFSDTQNGSGVGSVVGSFLNTGGITATGQGNGVYGNGGFGTFTNSGTISAPSNAGVATDGGIVTFVNSGTISGGGNGPGTYINGPVSSFSNSGMITSTQGMGAVFDGAVQTFQNASGATIKGTADHGVGFFGGLGNGTNAGSIVSTGANHTGLIVNNGGTFTNSGLIEGADAVIFDGPPGAGGVFINSGTVRQTNPGNHAIGFFQNAASNDTLRILTGSEIYGRIDFANSGADTFDFANFYGTTVLEVNGFDPNGDDTLVSGDRPFAWLAPNVIAIVDPTGNTSIGPTTTATLVAIRDILGQQLGGLQVNGLGGDDVFNYAPQRQPSGAEAATAVLSDLDVGGNPAGNNGVTIWGQAFGGFSHDSAPVDLSNLYGGIVFGTHVELMEGTKLGGLASYARSNYSVAGGQHTINSDTGVLGLYGTHDAGMVQVDFSLLGGGSGHSSSRQVVNLGVLETATASFSSWFISPEIGISIPILEGGGGELNVAASTSYIHGEVSGYDETTPTTTATIGALPIRVWDGRLELNGSKVVGQTEHGNVTFTGKAGVFVQSNLGGSALPITLAGTTINYVVPGTTGYGIYAGAGLVADIGSGVSLGAAVNGSVRNDGLVEGSASVGVSGKY